MAFFTTVPSGAESAAITCDIKIKNRAHIVEIEFIIKNLPAFAQFWEPRLENLIIIVSTDPFYLPLIFPVFLGILDTIDESPSASQFTLAQANCRQLGLFHLMWPNIRRKTMPTDSITLYYRAGSSDKIYSASIAERDGAFVVNFAFGRRGSTPPRKSSTSSSAKRRRRATRPAPTARRISGRKTLSAAPAFCRSF